MSVTARVRLRPASERREIREHWRRNRDSFTGPPWLLDAILDQDRDADRLELRIRLAAIDDAGRRIDAGNTFGVAGPRRGIAAIWHRYRGPALSEDPGEHERLLEETYRVGLSDIEDAINQMLGRDPELHRPPRLAWEPLIAALASAGVEIDEARLIELPLTVEIDDEVAAALQAS